MTRFVEQADAVVIGASVAGVSTVRALRRLGFDGSIVLLNERREPECDRPPLSKQYLAGEWDRPRVTLLKPEEAATLDVDVWNGVRAVGLDPQQRSVALEDGRTLRYDNAVVATGAVARPGLWGRSGDLMTVRSADDADRLKQRLRGGSSVVVIGGGYLGSEVAATANRAGCQVVVIDPLVLPQATLLGRELGAHLARLHERHGVETRFGRRVLAVDRDGARFRVVLDDGAVVDADTVIAAVGAAPNTNWLAGSGLDCTDGLMCDERLRAGGRLDVHGAGDVARWLHPRFGSIRLEHWTSATEHGSAVAADIVEPASSRPVGLTPYVWSDLYGQRLQIVGMPAHAVQRIVLGELADDGRGAVLYADENGQVCGAATLNAPRAALTCRRAVAMNMPLDSLHRDVAQLL